MSESGTALAQLTRLLYLLPAAARPEGLSVSAAAELLGVDEETIHFDIRTVSDREFYHAAGTAEDLRVEVEADRIRMTSGGKFSRPGRLGPREALATHLALRGYADGFTGEERDRVIDLAGRIGESLASVEVDGLADLFSVAEAPNPFGGVMERLRTALLDRRRCRIVYLSPGRSDPSERTIDPYAMVVSRGRWYVTARCGLSESVRVFRVDRIVEVQPTGESFSVPAGYDPADHPGAGDAPSAAPEAVVRYSGAAAVRLPEAAGAELGPDGSVRIAHPIFDPDWLVRHVLGFGGGAVVESPPDLRESVAEAAGRFVSSRPGG